MAVPCVRQRFSWVLLFLFLLFIFAKMFTSLMVFAGVFIHSNKVLISPFRFCLMGRGGGLSCDEQTNILRGLVILSLYAPLVLVAFALQATMFAVYGRDQGTLRVSVVCQTASCLLTFMGIVMFMGVHWPYMSLADVTVWFYVCVCVPAELAVTAQVTRRLGRWLTAA